MRRLIYAVVLGLVVTTGVAQAAGPKDYAKGSGVAFTGAEFSFNAESDPAGGSPKGTMRFHRETPFGLVDIVADVTCMSVIGTPGGGGLALIGGDVLKSTGYPFDGLFFYVRDSGQPGGADDAFHAEGLTDGPREDACQASFPGELIQSGDITVIDE
jgi:hypothetical protein